MAQDENFMIELVFSYMKSATFKKFVTHDRDYLRNQRVKLSTLDPVEPKLPLLSQIDLSPC